MQKKPALFLLNEAAGNQLSTTLIYFFQAKHLSKGEKKKTLIPLWKAASNAGFGILTRQVHKTDEHTPFSKGGTKRNQDNPSWEELHAAIKALIKY